MRVKKIARVGGPRPTSAMAILMRRRFGTSSYMRSLNHQRLRFIRKIRAWQPKT